MISKTPGSGLSNMYSSRPHVNVIFDSDGNTGTMIGRVMSVPISLTA